ncbi:MAG: enoyl-CoA hydratase/isomerase family protein [Alphaproteobacteria bacterium]|nr:enoyl-CoA hydratase/isomerase family protein [Alphaproteobacteria bacterium]
MSAEDPVLCEIDARGVATVTLNRPAVGNAYNDALIDALIATFARLAREPEPRCVILRGAGRHFQAGADLSFLRRLAMVAAADNLEFSRRTIAAIEGLQHFPRPTIAVIRGGCFGGGIGIAAACDIAVAAADAMFAISEVRWGITAAPILPLLAARLGPRVLGRLALTGERFDAAQALRVGLVHEVHPAADLEAAAQRVVDELLMAAPGAAAATKALIAEAAATPDTPAFRERIVIEAAARRRLPEAVEGLASFAAKRRPKWYRAP